MLKSVNLKYLGYLLIAAKELKICSNVKKSPNPVTLQPKRKNVFGWMKPAVREREKVKLHCYNDAWFTSI